MALTDKIIVIKKTDLVAQVKELFDKKYRIVCITCVKEPSGQEKAQKFELTYSFDKDYSFTSLRVELTPGEDISSITSVYGAAYLYENEIHDLYGISIKGINLDFKGTFYKVSIPAPFNPACGCGTESKG